MIPYDTNACPLTRIRGFLRTGFIVFTGRIYRRKAQPRNNEVEILNQLQADFLLSEMLIDR